jgi:GDP-L-fucose synthase
MLRREFLHVRDCADALVFLMRYSGEARVNVGAGRDISIADLARFVARLAGFKGELVFDRSRPDGTPPKLLSIGLLTALGCCPGFPSRTESPR